MESLIVREGRSLVHQLMPSRLDLHIGKVTCENRGKSDAHCSDCYQRQPMPETGLHTAHASPKNSRQCGLSGPFTHCSLEKIALILVKFFAKRDQPRGVAPVRCPGYDAERLRHDPAMR
jgi:hypothetical protein